MLAARPGSTGHGPPSPAPSTLHCVLAVLVPPAAAVSGALHAGALHAGGDNSRGLGAGVSGPDAQDPDLLCSWAAWLVMARQALSPPRRAAYARALCGPPRRPGALHTGALHAGGAPSCGLGSGETGVSLAQELSRGGCARRGGPWAPGVSPFCPQGCPRVSSPASRKGPGLLQLAGFTWHSLHLTVGAGFHRRWRLSLLLWPLYGAGILALRLPWRPELSTLALSMQAALPAAFLNPTSRARMLLPGGPALHVGSRA
jgi:hypothetical protein